MRLKSWSSFWTILATVAGVIGAGAAVYPLFTSEQQAAHLAAPDDFDLLAGVYVETFSDPISLTGNWYIRRGPWWRLSSLRTGNVVGEYAHEYVQHRSLHLGYELRATTETVWRTMKDMRVAANSKKFVTVQREPVQDWAGGPIRRCDASEFQIGLEYRWKGGTSWATMKLPYCVQ